MTPSPATVRYTVDVDSRDAEMLLVVDAGYCERIRHQCF
jgi:hypothetical protein